MSIILEKYSKLFPDSKEKYRTDFFWCYDLILNKSCKIMEQTIFCPIFDLMSYSRHGNVELNVKNIFKLRFFLIFKFLKFDKKTDEKRNYSKCLKYIVNNKKHLNQLQYDLIFNRYEDISEEELQEIILEINLKKISSEKIEIHNMDFFENECSIYEEKTLGNILF